MTDEEREECELMRGRLMLIVRTLEAVKDFPDDGSSSYAMDTIIREDVPAALAIIDRQEDEIKRLRTMLNNIIKHAESRQCVVEEELLKECEVLHSKGKRSRKLHRALSGEMGSLGTILKRAEGVWVGE